MRLYERERADLERQTDALVLKSLTSLVSAAEDLKARLRRDTDSLLEEYRRNKRGLENDISMVGAERQRLRQETDDERDRILYDARETADRIVREAEAERESLLGEVRGMEQRLRALEAQILQVLGEAGGIGAQAAQAREAPPAPRPSGASVESQSGAPFDGPMRDAAGVAPGVTAIPSTLPASVAPSFLAAAPSSPPTDPLPSSSRIANTPDEEMTASLPTIEDGDADADEPTASEVVADTTHPAELEPADHLEASIGPIVREPLADEVTRSVEPAAAPPVSPPSLTPPVTAPSVTPLASTPDMASESVPASGPTMRSVAPADAATSHEPVPAERRSLQLVFDGVPGYQQAAAIERAVSDLAEDGDVEIIEFEQGQLVLQVQGIDPRSLADRLVAKPPLPMRLVASGQDNATFQLTPG